MHLHTPLFFLLPTLILLCTLIPQTTARQPATSFCKCICFTNSTIIALNTTQPTTTPPQQNLLSHRTPQDPEEPSSPDQQQQQQQHKRLTCSDCTRAFCLDADLAICKGAKEEDVFTTCFQRDSLKDETIVLLFLALTMGLLGWALVKPWIDRVRDTETVQRYAPVGNLNLNLGLGALRSGGNSRRGGPGLPAYRDDGSARHRPTDSGGSESFARQGGLNS